MVPRKKGIIKQVFEDKASYSVTVGLDSKDTFGEFATSPMFIFFHRYDVNALNVNSVIFYSLFVTQVVNEAKCHRPCTNKVPESKVETRTNETLFY
jgi:hypothetical protein